MEKAQQRKKNFTYFIGIDVSRNKLDLAVRNTSEVLFHREITNEKSNIIEFVAELKKLARFRMANSLWCMENSGYYVNHALQAIYKLKANVHLGNPTHIKNSLGLIRDKSDRLDSIRLANYAFRHRDELICWKPKRPEIVKLAALTTIRTRLTNVIGIIKIPLKDQRGFIDAKVHKQAVDCCKGSLKAMVDDLNILERLMLRIIHSDERLKRLFEIICSVPCVGPVTAIQMIVCTNEFLDIDCARKLACYSGIAPFKSESGLMTGRALGKVSKISNRKMKALLHICAVGTIRKKGEFQQYYLRRCAEGKPPMTVINAIRNKIVRRVYSCIKHDRLYEANSGLLVRQPPEASGELLVTLSKPKQRKRTKFACRSVGNALN